MRSVSYTRATIGIMILVGLLWWRPLVWFCGIMMLYAGLTGVCFLELFYRLVLGRDRDDEAGTARSGSGGCV